MKSIIFLLCISGIFTLSVSGDEWEQKFRSNQEKFHQQTREIHESIRGGDLSHEEGQQKLAKISLEHAEKSKKMHWNRMERKIEGEVSSGRMSREMADEKYRQIKESMERKEEVAHELESKIKDSLNELREAVQAGEISEEDARMEGQEIRAHLHHEIRMAHMEIDLDAEEARLDRAVEEGKIGEDEAEERLAQMQDRMESMEMKFHQRMEQEEKAHEDERGAHWEDEEELWEQVAQGMKAAVRLGRMSENEAREIWEEWKEEAENDYGEEQ